jgi:hypothetical protein
MIANDPEDWKWDIFVFGRSILKRNPQLQDRDRRRLFGKEELIEWVKGHPDDRGKKSKPSPSQKRKGE